MFKNVGKVIKGIAKFIFVIDLLAVLISAIIALAGFIDGGESGIGVLVFILILGVGFIISYLSVMMLYAFGSIVDDLKLIRVSLCGTEPAPAYAAPTPASAPAYAAPAPAPTPAPAPAPEPVEETMWTCSKCSSKNPMENAFCTNCGNSKNA